MRYSGLIIVSTCFGEFEAMVIVVISPEKLLKVLFGLLSKNFLVVVFGDFLDLWYSEKVLL